MKKVERRREHRTESKQQQSTQKPLFPQNNKNKHKAQAKKSRQSATHTHTRAKHEPDLCQQEQKCIYTRPARFETTPKLKTIVKKNLVKNTNVQAQSSTVKNNGVNITLLK